jgi:FkbM family methyltransferase
LQPSIKSIFAFEASDETFNTLKSNVELNGLKEKISCAKKAVSNTVGSIVFQIESPLSGINSVLDTSIHDNNLFNEKRIVECCTIDEFREITNSIIAIKIDVEGHENNVLQGAKNTLKKMNA